MKILDYNQIILKKIKKKYTKTIRFNEKKIRANKYIPKRLQVEEEKYKEKEPYSTYSL